MVSESTGVGNIERELDSGERFGFGKNWKNFLSDVNEDRIREAEASLITMLGQGGVAGKTFLDMGCGSGLFSLAARRLGASVFSFDYDPSSVWCADTLKKRYFDGDEDWTVERGSVLDIDYLRSLGKFDIVYSWGVLHHTGKMWEALDNVDICVKETGKLYIALYNYQQFASRYWLAIKRVYNKVKVLRPALIAIHLIYPVVPSMIVKFFQGRKPPRGMTYWYDLVDWLGGYPFEVATPKQVFDEFNDRGYILCGIKTVGGKMGCNEFVFKKGA